MRVGPFLFFIYFNIVNTGQQQIHRIIELKTIKILYMMVQTTLVKRHMIFH